MQTAPQSLRDSPATMFANFLPNNMNEHPQNYSHLHEPPPSLQSVPLNGRMLSHHLHTAGDLDSYARSGSASNLYGHRMQPSGPLSRLQHQTSANGGISSTGSHLSRLPQVAAPTIGSQPGGPTRISHDAFAGVVATTHAPSLSLPYNTTPSLGHSALSLPSQPSHRNNALDHVHHTSSNSTNKLSTLPPNISLLTHTISLRDGVCDVWQENFMEGIHLLRCLSTIYTYVAVDTEFPGIVAKVNHDYMDASEQAYQNIRINLNMLKPIQIGFSFMNEGGETKEDHCTTVQFNMRWNIEDDTHATDSIRLLECSGIDFSRLKIDGIEADEFAAELIGTGAVLNKNLKHIGYHSAYDWAYLLKVLTGWTELPNSFVEYHEMLKFYFPAVLDVKVFQAHLSAAPKGGLQELADFYGIPRYGSQHQAGSDARLTADVYFRISQDERLQRKPDLQNLIFGLNYGQGSNLWVPSQPSSGADNDSSGSQTMLDASFMTINGIGEKLRSSGLTSTNASGLTGHKTNNVVLGAGQHIPDNASILEDITEVNLVAPVVCSEVPIPNVNGSNVSCNSNSPMDNSSASGESLSVSRPHSTISAVSEGSEVMGRFVDSQPDRHSVA